jgi:uncharacterized membrane protein YgcG
MKTRSFQSLVLTITAVAAVSLLAVNVVAQDSSTATTASQAAPQLSYGVPQVLQLSQAKITDSTIIAYIRNSGNNYGLDTAQIIYLKQQGVSSDVINVMLNQRTQPAQPTAQTVTSQPASTDNYNAQSATAQPSVSYVQTAPPQTVYVIPDTQTYQYNEQLYYPYTYPYYPYYGGYYGWPYPAVSFSLGWGGYRGGWGGGYHGGGGWHGGGGHHH